MAQLDKLIAERSKAFHRIGSLYVELTKMQADSPKYSIHLQEIADLKLAVVKLQRRIVISRMKKVEKYFAGAWTS